MSDLIDRQEAIDALKKVAGVGNRALDAIRALPAADPKKGKWIDFSMSIKGVPTEACGECGEWSYGMGKNYCPNCGAKMRGEEE